MDQLNLLIADSTEDFSAALIAALQDSYRIHHCTNGKDAFAHLLNNPPDVMILDLMIPELDGITLLHKAADAGICPIVLATTRLYNEYVLETIRELNVAYLMLKPCDPYAAAERARDLGRRVHSDSRNMEDPIAFVKKLLVSLNVPSHLRGSAFLREAITLMAGRPDISITKELYPTVGTHFGANYAQVERSIRNAINLAWEHRIDSEWAKYFHRDTDGTIPRPSNGVFISRLADELRPLLNSRTP